MSAWNVQKRHVIKGKSAFVLGTHVVSKLDNFIYCDIFLLQVLNCGGYELVNCIFVVTFVHSNVNDVLFYQFIALGASIEDCCWVYH